jgi:uncharacterized protein YndB with AHSA1/START domain
VRDSGPVIKEIYIAASRELVFEFLTESGNMARWLDVPTKTGDHSGGTPYVYGRDENAMRGQFAEVVPFGKIVFDWVCCAFEPLDSLGSTTVEIELTAMGDGTLLRLTHRDIPTHIHRNTKGWSCRPLAWIGLCGQNARLSEERSDLLSNDGPRRTTV